MACPLASIGDDAAGLPVKLMGKTTAADPRARRRSYTGSTWIFWNETSTGSPVVNSAPVRTLGDGSVAFR